MTVGIRPFLACCAAALIVSGCSAAPLQPQPPKTHWLRYSDALGEISTLNPHLSSESNVEELAGLTMAYLFRYDAGLRPVPELATAFPTQSNGGVSADGKTIVFHLRRGVRWSDGKPFTSADVTFTAAVIRNRANAEVSRVGWDLVADVEAPDRYTVVFHLTRPFALFEPAFFGYGLFSSPCILPRHLFTVPEIGRSRFDAKPVGIGPFRIVSWHRSGVELEANPYYWRGLAKLKRITYVAIPSLDKMLEALQTGTIDLWARVPPAYIDGASAISTMHVAIVQSGAWSHLSFNVTHPLVTDRRVREAIRLAVDRRRIVSDILGGHADIQEALLSPQVPIVPRNIPLVPYDPAAARKLLDAAGWHAGPGGIRERYGRRLLLSLAYNQGAQSNDAIAQLLRSELAAVGIELQVRRYPPHRFYAPYARQGIVSGDTWDLITFGHDTDPNGSLANLVDCDRIPPAGENITRYCNPRVDAWSATFETTFDEGRRAALLERIERQLVDDAPLFTLDVAREGFAYSRRLENYRPSMMTPFGDVLKIDI